MRLPRQPRELSGSSGQQLLLPTLRSHPKRTYMVAQTARCHILVAEMLFEKIFKLKIAAKYSIDSINIEVNIK
jgi:hypothetical protein